MEDTRLPKCVMFGELVGGAGCGLCEGEGKIVDVVFPGRPQSFRHQRGPVGDWSTGRGGMAQNGGTRGGTFRGEMNRCRGSQGWTTACSRMPGRDGNDQGEDSPKQADLCWFARHKWRELVSSWRLVCRCHDVFLWCYLCFVLLRFRLYAFVEAATLRSVVLRYAGAPTAIHVSFFFLWFNWRCRFFRVFFVPLSSSLRMESTSYVLSFRMVFFFLVTMGWIFRLM